MNHMDELTKIVFAALATFAALLVLSAFLRLTLWLWEELVRLLDAHSQRPAAQSRPDRRTR